MARDAATTGFDDSAKPAELAISLTASDVMNTEFVSVPADATVFAAFESLTQHHVHHLPVVQADGRCVALLDATEVAARMHDAGLHGGSTLLKPDGAVGPLWVSPQTPLRRVAAEMTAANADACCVVDPHGRMLGLLTARDFIAAFARCT